MEKRKFSMPCPKFTQISLKVFELVTRGAEIEGSLDILV